MVQVTEAHLGEYDTRPDMVVTAPGRYHLAGEHSWYFKDTTLSMAVDLPVYVAISIRQDTSLRFYFPQLKERKRSNISTLKYRKEDRWANAVKAIIFGFLELGYLCQGMNITIWSDILPSAGFGITTAIKVAAAEGIRKLFFSKMTDKDLLSVIEKGNVSFLNSENYISDIYTAMFAKANFCLLIDHSKNTHTLIPFNIKDYSIILTDARVPRITVWNEDSLRTAENFLLMAELKIQKNGYWIYEENEVEINEVLSSVGEDARRRLICLMKEHKCVLDAVEGLKSGNINVFARAVNKSHEGMRDLYNISCPEIDWLVKRVLEFDASASGRMPTACSRITGKGFGRCTYTVIKNQDIELYTQKLAEYDRIFGFHPSYYIVHPADGVHVLESW